MATALLLVALAAPASSQERLSFIGVALDQETRAADEKLQDYLNRRADVSFAPEEMEYGQVIDRLAKWRRGEGHFLARATPYVHVASEMLGANLEILATYVSNTTGSTTYHSYLVVSRRAFPAAPSLADIVRMLSEKKGSGRFIYHSRFSTSSYFLPALWLRSNGIYNMDESTASMTALACAQIEENSSSALVERVARGEADLAAVWDGTKSKFERGEAYERAGKLVHFVQLPTRLPNDLLVCSSSLDPQTKERLRAAIASMGPDEVRTGDFRSWVPVREATEARAALAELRHLARPSVPPVTVDVTLEPRVAQSQRTLDLVEAARQAVRLSGTELKLFDEDFHEHIDVVWRIEPVHDGAVVLRSAMPGSDIDDQIFRLSFRDPDDLTKRLVSIVHSRLHRIRYVWPHSGSAPIVIRDLPFSPQTGAAVKAQAVSWLNPEKNEFRAGPLFTAHVGRTSFHTYELISDDFAKTGRVFEADPMSNATYRIYLLRSAEERPLFRNLTVIFVALLVAAAAALIIDLFRSDEVEAGEEAEGETEAGA